jgi:hypothetical protein
MELKLARPKPAAMATAINLQRMVYSVIGGKVFAVRPRHCGVRDKQP